MDEKFIWEMDEAGHHRIIAPDGTVGAPSLYEHPASLTYKGEIFIVFTGYYEGAIPTERILKVTECPTVSREAKEHLIRKVSMVKK